MSLTESLTVEISADSSQLESELDRVGSLVDGLSSRLAAVSQAASGAANSVGRIGAAVASVNQLNAALDGVASRLKSIQTTRVSIDVSAAIAALSQLSAAISRVASQLAALNAMSASTRTNVPLDGGGLSGGGGSSQSSDGQPVRFAKGGFVTGPRGEDRVPAYVTAGEFVVRPEVVERVGRPFFEQLNHGTMRPADRPAAEADESTPAGSQRDGRVLIGTAVSNRSRTTNAATSVYHDVTIHVAQNVELDDVLESLDANETRRMERFG